MVQSSPHGHNWMTSHVRFLTNRRSPIIARTSPRPISFAVDRTLCRQISMKPKTRQCQGKFEKQGITEVDKLKNEISNGDLLSANRDQLFLAVVCHLDKSKWTSFCWLFMRDNKSLPCSSLIGIIQFGRFLL